MIRLGLRLSLGSGRDAGLRVFAVAAAVALGVGLLLVALAGVNGLHAQAERGAWLDTASSSAALCSGPGCPRRLVHSSLPALWWLYSVDQFGTQAIDRVDVAATATGAPVPPGIPRLPVPGTYYVSPALSKLMSSVPVAQLRDRFPGRQAGVIGQAALPSPASLIVVVSYTSSQLSRAPGSTEVRTI